MHCFSNSKVSFDSAVHDQTRRLTSRQREFASLDISGEATAPRSMLPQAHVEKLAGGFFNVAGGAVAPNGRLLLRRFKLAAHLSVGHLQAGNSSPSPTHPIYPVNLAFDKAGDLIVISQSGNGTVYSFNPNVAGNEMTILPAESAVARPGLTPVLPVSDWLLQRDESRLPLPRTYQYLSPDKTTYISATEGFVKGATSWGVKSSDLLRAFSIAPAVPGKLFYFTSESELMTLSATVGPDGNLANVKLFANQGGEGVTADADGNVYIVAGQVYVYSLSGQLMRTIQAPERPIQATFGGKDGRTLFILGRTALYVLPTS